MRGLDLHLGPGERVLLLGPSGSGKSTLLRALAGLLDPAGGGEHEGSLLVGGGPPRAVRHRSGLLFQDPEAQIVMGRAGDDVAFGLENRCVPTHDIWPRVDLALERVGWRYGRDRSTAQLSGGERQRLALAGTLALEPGLLLLDEPTANLDEAGAATFRSSLAAALEATGATMLLVEHRVAESLDLVDRVVVLQPGGGVVADGPAEAVFAELGTSLAESGVWVPGVPAAPGSRVAAATAGPAVALVATEEIAYRYPGATADAVAGVSIELPAARALAITGPNGAGKSTLAMLVAGLLRPTRGRVVATEALAPGRAGEAPWRWRARDLARRIGTVFQDPEHQFLAGTVRDELLVGPTRAGVGPGEARRRADELLERLHLGHLAAANPFTLSGGEQRRLSVGTALASAPALLVLDEPTFGQDLRTWRELLALLAGLRDEGRGICVVSHDADFVEALADRVVRLEA